jgi:hypothetical protein
VPRAFEVFSHHQMGRGPESRIASVETTSAWTEAAQLDDKLRSCNLTTQSFSKVVRPATGAAPDLTRR